MLTNGIRILYIFIGGEVVHVQIDVKTGSDDEFGDNELNSYELESAHFLEYLMAQFTSTKNSTKSSIKIAQELENLGVTWNAFTTPHRTGYYLTGPKETFCSMKEYDFLKKKFFIKIFSIKNFL